ncbi:T9SS type B sorting domain-containing protein [Flavobacterium sp. J49]|uniref:T9SS type B sorting domain-containing protein n=1 Tax=Flavobacterium sp. J49 TaxID=2718534 RepID=UPI00159395C5|nr:T9SS type B sorting domain-containing protein [Flavobacterium sp. J49]MBF6642440.1 T9SS type B sorting domain-containing protein [Flavobacterium sp. J49]NIC03686.1 T9SS type B sorting domain-containing protein [Flavobacterium sp. J49]
MKKWFYRLTLVLFLLCPITGFSFTITVTATQETCAGNGTITINVSNPDPAGSIVYVVYKLPNLTTPFASSTSNIINGLTAGDYHIVVRETVGSTTTIQEADITISSTVTSLTYTVQVTNEACSDNSTAIVNVISGTASIYEIFSGPITFPPQSSNTFPGLPTGVYRIKVIDHCGNALVQTFVVDSNPEGLNITAPDFSNTVPPSCNAIVASHTITQASGTVIAYPLTIQYVLYLPGGTVDNRNIILNTGNPNSEVLTQTIPFFVNQNYPYQIHITDACGVTYPFNFVVTNDIVLDVSVQDLECDQHYFILTTLNNVGNYTLNFDVAPAGFDPVTFNTSYPGPFTQAAQVFGSQTQPVPIGDYTVTATDMCGKITTFEFEVESDPPQPNIVGNNRGCVSSDGQIIAFLSPNEITAATVTSAPAAYPFAMPHNVSALINAGGVLVIDPVPFGNYTLDLTDECGNILEGLTVSVLPYEDLGVSSNILPGCDRGSGSVEISSNNGNLTSVIITNAPSNFPFPLPYNVTNHIVASGKLYLNNLPAGNYVFNTTDSCGFTKSSTITIEGYTVTNSSFSLVVGCGSFDLPLSFSSNLTGAETFWLQKLLDPNTDTWGHPETETTYVPNTVPDTTTGIPLQNNTTNLNLIFNGIFRIVHHFTSYNNGSDINANIVANEIKDCVEILAPTLTFDRVLNIIDVYRVPCTTNGNLDIILFTTGEPPLHFTIIEKDGNPFFIDNGTSNVFYNLEPAIYKFQIEDSCGNTIIRNFDVSDLESLVVVYPSCNMVNCSTNISGNETFNLSTQTATIMGIQSPTNYTISYHISLTDAENNTNPITNITNFNPATNPQTVYVRLIFNQFPNCYQTGSFDLITGQKPRIPLSPEYSLCDGQPVALDAGIGNLPTTTYTWSNGVTDAVVTISEPGTTNISVTATNEFGLCNNSPQTCSTSSDIVVNIVIVPEIDFVETYDWTSNDNGITVVTTQTGDFEYSIDGITYQTDNNFTHLLPGLYTVYVRDINGCQIVTEEVWLLNYPHYFTPNGDGIHDYWYIKNSENEPNFQVYIYDRYGKLITGFPSGSIGWDGTLNGKMLFSDDYWFVVHREDGRILKGHFTLKR